MPNLEQQFLEKENFYLAFKRLSYYLKQSNEWYDPIDLSTYEANLETNLYKLIEKIKSNEFSTQPIEPLPFPKKNSKENQERLRQYFKISIEDQIVWIAIVNVIGKFFEERMPFWSYGNRLFQPIWYDENGKLTRGGYTNSASNFYRKWNQSWPFYRRHISMTIKTMGLKSNFKTIDLDSEIEKNIFEEEKNEQFANYEYLDPNFWLGRKTDKLYWAGVDFKNFFPSISAEHVLKCIKKYVVRTSGRKRDDTTLIFNTIEKLLKFPLNIDGWDEKLLLNENYVNLKSLSVYEGVPTGLLVSGFLANIAMLDVDILLNDYILKNKKIALFKFVDDQIILSDSKKELLLFLNFYKSILSNSSTGVDFQEEKTLPENCFNLNSKGNFILERKAKPIVNIQFPEPLMTNTLLKMSAINEEDYQLLDDQEIDNIISDLKHFLLADFPDSEMKRETRMAFASMKLCALSKFIKPKFKNLDLSLDDNLEEYKKHIKINTKDKRYKNELEKIKKIYLNNRLDIELKIVNKKYNEIFILLLKAANENPDKLKLWKRLIEFCFNTGFDGLKLVLRDIIKIKIHDDGKEYILHYCLFLIQEKSLLANSIVNQDSSFWKVYTSKKIIISVGKLNIKKEFLNYIKKPFAIQSLNNFNEVQSILKGEIKESIEPFLLYILNSSNDSLKISIWEKYIEQINLTLPLSWSLLIMFPNKIPKTIIRNIQNIDKLKIESLSNLIFENYEFRNKKNGIIYEMFEGRIDELKEFSESYSEIFKILSQENENYISLNKWLKNVLNHSKNNSWLDVRLFEWSILEIIKQIGNALIEEQKKDTIFYQSNIYSFHPSNYLIPKEWILNEQLTWKKWKNTIRTHKIILNDEEFILNDTRYFPAEKRWKNNEISYFFGLKDITLILELSTLMVKLFSKSFSWKNHANKIKFIDQHFNEVSNILESVSVSSDTRLLLSNIFSKSNLIDYNLNGIFIFDDGKTINSLPDFITEINAIQASLQKNHLELIGSKPRQLTVLDIDKINLALRLN